RAGGGNRAVALRVATRSARWRSPGRRRAEAPRPSAGGRSQRGRRLTAVAPPHVPGGNVYDKYRTRNPIERRLVDGFLDRLERLIDRTGAREAHEVGCGEGELSLLLARRGLRVRGTDASAAVVDEARRRARVAGLERHSPLPWTMALCRND